MLCFLCLVRAEKFCSFLVRVLDGLRRISFNERQQRLPRLLTSEYNQKKDTTYICLNCASNLFLGARIDARILVSRFVL